MLQESSDLFLVYPSWATGALPYEWADLPAMLADPLASLAEKKPHRYYLDCNFSMEPVETEFWAGDFGGGVIRAAEPKEGRWLGEMVFQNTNMRSPDGICEAFREGAVKCIYLEPYDVYMEDDGHVRRTKLYLANVTCQHFEQCGDKVIWAVRHVPGRRSEKLIEDLCGNSWLARTPLHITRLPEPPQFLEDSLSKYFVSEKYQASYFEVAMDSVLAGFQAAAATYVAYALKQMHPRVLKGVHVCAEFERPLDGMATVNLVVW